MGAWDTLPAAPRRTRSGAIIPHAAPKQNKLRFTAAEPFRGTEEPPELCISPLPAGRAGQGVPATAAARAAAETSGAPRAAASPSPRRRGVPALSAGQPRSRSPAAATTDRHRPGVAWGAQRGPGRLRPSLPPRPRLGPAPRRGGGWCRLPGRGRRRRVRSCHPAGRHGGGGWRQGQWAPLPRQRGSPPGRPLAGRRRPMLVCGG